MEIEYNKLSDSMFSNVKDVIAGAFKYKDGNFERAKYIVERLREIYGDTSYDFSCIVADNSTCFDAYYNYYHDICFKCFFEDKFIVLWSGK